MKIAYINKSKAKAKPSIDVMLELAYLRDMRRVWNRDKAELSSLGLTEVSFVTKCKEILMERKGCYMH